MSNVDSISETVASPGVIYYPDSNSYRMSSLSADKDGRGTTGNRYRGLRKAKLYSVSSYTPSADTVATYLPGSPVDTAMAVDPTVRILTKLSKEFQYNPSEMEVTFEMAPTTPDVALLSGENSPAAAEQQIGAARTGVDMLFEVHAGQQGRNLARGYSRLGVGKDIIDIYAIVKGDESLFEVGDQNTLSAITKEMIDLVARGSEVLIFGRVALAYSPDFIIYGYVVNMSWRFLKWNHNLIPTMGYVHLDIDIHNLGNQSTINNAFGVGPTILDTANPGAVERSGGTTVTNSSAPSSARQLEGWNN